MKIDITPITSHVRVFLDGDMSAANKDPYDLVMTVQHLNNDRAYVSGMAGVMTTKIFRGIEKKLKASGIQVIDFEKGGRQRSIAG